MNEQQGGPVSRAEFEATAEAITRLIERGQEERDDLLRLVGRLTREMDSLKARLDGLTETVNALVVGLGLDDLSRN